VVLENGHHKGQAVELDSLYNAAVTLELLTGLVTFAFVASITPGPNNLMLMASGANFGFRRSIPHLLGVGLGFTLMTMIVGAGLATLFDTYPVIYTLLKIVSVLYMGFLAMKIATAEPLRQGRFALAEQGQSSGQSLTGTPISFVQAVLFQWVNPKAWAMALTAISVYSPSNSLRSIGLVALLFGAINLPSISLWTVMGQQIRRWLTDPLHLRFFNIGMAILLLLSLVPVLLQNSN
jgi:threonine/homoserine/homoserine lactone efflux protein